MNTNLIAILKSTTLLMNAKGSSLHAIVEELEFLYECYDGDGMGKKLLTSCALAWINEGCALKMDAVSGYATV